MFTHGKIGCYIEKHVHLNDNNHYSLLYNNNKNHRFISLVKCDNKGGLT